MKKAFMLSVLTLYHPVKAFSVFKNYRGNMKMLGIVALVPLALIVRIIYIFNVNFIVADVDVAQINLAFEIGKILVPLFSWGLCTFGLTTIFSGEAKLKETMTGCCLALVPYIIFTPIMLAFSKVVSSGEIAIYNFFNGLIIAYMIIILLISLKVLNDMSFIKTIVVAIVSVIGMLALWILFIVYVVLISQVGVFVFELATEIKFIGG